MKNNGAKLAQTYSVLQIHLILEIEEIEEILNKKFL